jgi:hypothetical protein
MVYFAFPNVKYVRVSYPSPETYFIIPDDWNEEDLTVKHGALFYKGKATMFPAHDFCSKNHQIEIVDENHMDFEEVKSFVGN